MPKFADYSTRDILDFQDQLRAALGLAHSLEEAAEQLVDMFFERFSDSIVLARCFVTIPYEQLPIQNRQFVGALALQKGIEAHLRDDTIVLSLMATRGLKTIWNDRKLSRGHIGIPLISTRFVDSIPMVARLLKELEIGLDWLEDQDMSFVERQQGAGWVSVFHVPDAATATDSQGRLIIPDQDFVQENNVATVFGLGGVYADGTIITLLVFTCDEIDKQIVEAYAPLMSSARLATAGLAQKHRFFW